MTELSKQTVECLNRAGWNPNRAIDTSEFEASLRAAGFVVSDAVLNFLKEYGGLRITYPHFKVANTQDDMHFDVSVVVRHVLPVVVDAYAKVLGKDLCPIGEASQGYMVLLMDEQGQVYAGYDDFFVYVGSSGVAAIEALCSGKDWK